jgi:2-keto-4-pentenoate hydratase/2-oxohepta-3-ene-1,7-dioic acid hydratase in catechol pathway
MRIAAVQTRDGRRLVVDVDGDHRRLEFDRDLLSLIQGDVDPRELTVGAAVEGELAAPLQPGKIVGIGLNYLDHIRESKLPQPAQPLVFAKFPSSVTGPNDPIVVDVELTAHVDWEVELGVIVGRRMRRVAAGAALDYVFGYTVCNDVSARPWAAATSWIPLARSRSATSWSAKSSASACCATPSPRLSPAR